MSKFLRTMNALSKKPSDYRKGPEGPAEQQTTTVVAGPTATVVPFPATTVVDDATATLVANPPTPFPASAQLDLLSLAGEMWRTEDTGSGMQLFPRSRVRRIERAQDALTHREEAVYNFLWGRKTPEPEESRLAQAGYTEIARNARVTRRNAALIVQRLFEKGFLQLEQRADTLHRQAAQYRVLGYRAALDNLRRRGRQWVVRTGNGVLFAYPIAVAATTTVVPGPPATVVTGQTATVVDGPTTTVVVEPATTPPSAPEPANSSVICEAAAEFGVAFDADASRKLIRRCQDYDPEATEDEIAHCLRLKLQQLRRSRNVGNWVGLLLTSVPLYFQPPAHEVARYRRQTQAAASSEPPPGSRELWEAVLADPGAPEEEKAIARECLQGKD